MSIAAVVSNALAQSGMSQMELASSIGVTQSYVSQICSGKKIPTFGTLSRISRSLGIPMKEFVREDDICEGYGLPDLSLTEDEIHMLLSYRKMSDKDQGLVHAMVDRIADSTTQNKYSRAKSRMRV